MLVASDIMSVFMGNPHKIFLNALLGLRPRNASAPAAVASPWSDNSREGNNNTIAKRRDG